MSAGGETGFDSAPVRPSSFCAGSARSRKPSSRSNDWFSSIKTTMWRISSIAPIRSILRRHGRCQLAPPRGPPTRPPPDPRNWLAQHPARADERRSLLVVEGVQARRRRSHERAKARVAPGLPRAPELLGQAVGEGSVGRRAVAVLVRQLLLLARLDDDRQVRTTIAARPGTAVVRAIPQ